IETKLRDDERRHAPAFDVRAFAFEHREGLFDGHVRMALRVAANADRPDSRALERARRNQCRTVLEGTFSLGWIAGDDETSADSGIADHGVQVGLEFAEGGDSPCREMGHRLEAELSHRLRRSDSGS